MFPPVWYKVRHPWFDPDTAYRLVAYTLPSESAWAQLTFVLETGHTVAINVFRCTALRPDCESRFASPVALFRPLTATERDQEWATKAQLLSRGPNPDLDYDLE